MYDWKITARKGLEQFAIGGLTYLSAYLAGLPPEQQAGSVILVLALTRMALNWLKNKD